MTLNGTNPMISSSTKKKKKKNTRSAVTMVAENYRGSWRRAAKATLLHTLHDTTRRRRTTTSSASAVLVFVRAYDGHRDHAVARAQLTETNDPGESRGTPKTTLFAEFHWISLLDLSCDFTVNETTISCVYCWKINRARARALFLCRVASLTIFPMTRNCRKRAFLTLNLRIEYTLFRVYVYTLLVLLYLLDNMLL